MEKITKKQKIDYLKRKYMNTCSELKPRNIQFELADGHEFAYVNLMGKKGLTIKKK